MSKRTFDDFDEFAEDYRDIHTKNVQLSGADSFYFAEMKVRLLEQYDKLSVLKVLDIGCGDGITEVYMQQYFPNWQVVGIDVSLKSIEVANNRQLSNTTFSTYNGSNIPFTDQSFDLVFMAGVLHHVSYAMHNQLIMEIYRVLKINGNLSLYEHNPLNPFTRYLVKTCVFDKDAVLLPYRYAMRLFAKNKLNVNIKKFIIFFPRKGIFSKFIFLEKYFKWVPLGGQYYLNATK